MGKIGSLDRRVQFQRASLSDDGFGEVATYANHGTPIWAGKMDLSDGERWRAGEVAANITTRLLVRHSSFTSALTPNDRAVCEGVTYEITGIKEAKGRRQWLEVTCAARAD